MRIAYLDCFSGISGDMFLGALVDAGVSAELLQQTVAALDIGATLEVSNTIRNGIRATKVDVIVRGQKDLPREVFQERGAHEHHHGELARVGAHALHHSGRSLPEIREIITNAPISDTAKSRATAIFEALGTAEARVHNCAVESIHFHEVGSEDAIVDIVCAAVGAEALKIDEWICSPLNVGGGTVQCAHGVFPVPAPATLELLRVRNAPVFSSGVQAELVTPTGAAIVNVLVDRFAPFPPMNVASIGHGAGYRDFAELPNVLRLTIGESSAASASSASELVTILEANLDDLNPQVFGYVIDRLLAEGALDVFTTPVQMKKNRPGVLLTVLCAPALADKLAGVIFRETTTLGLRMREERRQALARRHVEVQTPWGAVRMKLASSNGTVVNCAPEYDDCRRIAEEKQIPLKTVMQEAIRLYMERHHD
ncbi:MAG: nickel pincer cofactor biosynthesis protein LarC [Terriglobales bacterium]